MRRHSTGSRYVQCQVRDPSQRGHIAGSSGRDTLEKCSKQLLGQEGCGVMRSRGRDLERGTWLDAAGMHGGYAAPDGKSPDDRGDSRLRAAVAGWASL